MIDDGSVKVWVSASPTDGQANEAVCRLLAEGLRLPRSRVSVKRGHSGRSKVLRIEGLEAAEALLRLRQ